MSYTKAVRLYLSNWITVLLTAVPQRSLVTFIELFCGCLVSPEGWVTRAIGAITRSKNWTTYYKFLERGNIRTLRLARTLLQLVEKALNEPILIFVIDDTLVPRQSLKAPASTIRYDHAKKTNRARYIISQCWVTLGVSVCCFDRKYVLPIISRSVPVKGHGNSNKLTIALALVRALMPAASKPFRVMFDARCMRARLVLPLLARNIQVIGQARKDTALFLPPEAVVKRGPGRTRKYGTKITTDVMLALPATEITLTLFGKKQRIRLRSVIALARFLKGKLVHAVWSEFYDEDKQDWSKARLLLDTKIGLSSEWVIRFYARRWGIEPLFFNFKNVWGGIKLWQQKRITLELWMQIRSTAWTFIQLLSLFVEEAFPIKVVAPWRVKQPLTAGLVAQWRQMEFIGLDFSAGFDRKSSIFT
jgi:hypothetical protein